MDGYLYRQRKRDKIRVIIIIIINILKNYKINYKKNVGSEKKKGHGHYLLWRNNHACVSLSIKGGRYRGQGL